MSRKAGRPECECFQDCLMGRIVLQGKMEYKGLFLGQAVKYRQA